MGYCRRHIEVGFEQRGGKKTRCAEKAGVHPVAWTRVSPWQNRTFEWISAIGLWIWYQRSPFPWTQAAVCDFIDSMHTGHWPFLSLTYTCAYHWRKARKSIDYQNADSIRVFLWRSVCVRCQAHGFIRRADTCTIKTRPSRIHPPEKELEHRLRHNVCAWAFWDSYDKKRRTTRLELWGGVGDEKPQGRIVQFKTVLILCQKSTRIHLSDRAPANFICDYTFRASRTFDYNHDHTSQYANHDPCNYH